MESNDEILFEFSPVIRVFKDGRVERDPAIDLVTPASINPITRVSSKDVTIVPETGVSARLYLPNLAGEDRKRFPLLVYYHGGGFCVGRAFNPEIHNYVSSLVARANVVAVSVEYRLAPEHPIPASYDDSWQALQWVASHANGGPGPEAWLADHADFDRVFIAGESAGGNIAHHMTMRAGVDGLQNGMQIHGTLLIHPYLLGSDRVESEAMDPFMVANLERLWRMVHPSTAGLDDPLINPVAGGGAPSLAGLACKRALVCVGGKDVMRDRGRVYYEKLRESGWKGEAELYEAIGMSHTEHTRDPTSAQALAQEKVVCTFLLN